MRNNDLVRLVQHLDCWTRKIVQINSTYYVSIPQPVVEAANKRKGSAVKFRRAVDRESGKIVILMDI